METVEEKVLRELKPSLKNYIVPIVLGVVLIPFVVGFILLAWVAVEMFSNRYKVTTRRVIVRRGIIAKHTDEVEIRDVRSVNLRQGIIQRLFGIGDLFLATAGHEGVEVSIKGVNDPEGLKDLIRSQRAQ